MINPEQAQKLIEVTVQECKDCMNRGDVGRCQRPYGKRHELRWISKTSKTTYFF